MFRCILACDLKGGIVVRGVRGERDKYRPIQEYSRIVSTSDPVEMIEVIRPGEVYIADLDRITGTGDNSEIISTISQRAKVMVDAGVSRVEDAKYIKTASCSVILGTETAPLRVMEALQGNDAVVSIDLKHGSVVAADPALQKAPLEVVRKLNDLDLSAVIMLDMSRVGSDEGVDYNLLQRMVSVSKHPLIVGGGIRCLDDLERIEMSGATGAIVASAVHSGRIPLDTLR
ncbi:MAG TPA: HisA/HisF-related TIM barrel protein [Methanocella sp.]|nr:HisA/HisF-related TIM barrel protein [Methanocella sp.]